MATMNTVKAAVVAMALVGSVGTALAAEPVSGVEATVTAKAEVTGGQVGNVDGSGQDSGVQAYCWYETYCNYYGYCWTSWVCY